MDNNFCVYRHLNKINGKSYIGQTNNPERRFSKNGTLYKTSTYFYNAIEKYGWDSFEHIILEENLTQEEANKREKYYIQKYDTRNREKGYNILEGGNGLGDYYQDPVHRKEQSERKKKLFSEHPEKFFNIAEWSKQHPEQRKKHSEYMKEHYAESTMKQINEKRKKRVRCIETGEIFDSITDACRAIGASCGNLSNVLSGKRKTAAGFHWEIAM